VVTHHVWRTDDLTTITPELAQRYAADGLKATIDLRSDKERGVTGEGLLPELGVPSYHLPLTDDVKIPEWVGAATHDAAEATGMWYADIVESHPDRLITALEIIADTDAIAFHCTAGKDRTGILAAILLTILGADDDTIVADYAATRPNLNAIYARSAALITFLSPEAKFDKKAVAHPMMGAEPASMTAMLTTLRTRNGQVLAPLLDTGLTDKTVARLRTRLIA
jgi:protein-tyrosine phosphatase